MLRASGQATDTDIDLSLIAEGGAGGDGDRGDVPHADVLTRFVDAVAERSSDLPAVRDELTRATDEATMIDAAAVVAAFEMMTRIADGTGTTHPSSRIDDLEPIRRDLGLDGFESARRLEGHTDGPAG